MLLIFIVCGSTFARWIIQISYAKKILVYLFFLFFFKQMNCWTQTEIIYIQTSHSWIPSWIAWLRCRMLNIFAKFSPAVQHLENIKHRRLEFKRKQPNNIISNRRDINFINDLVTFWPIWKALAPKPLNFELNLFIS